MGYSKQVAWGLSWLSILKVITKLLTLAKIVVLARILSPNDFGIFGLVTVVLSLTEVFTETGVNPFLTQTPKNPNNFYNTAWVVSIVRGFLIGAVMILLSFFIAPFYHEPTLLGFMLIASIIPIIKGFINPAEIKFQREFAYHKDVYLRIVLVLVDVSFAVAFAMVFHSALAMILSQVIAAVLEVLITQMLITPRPKFTFIHSYLHEILRFGAWLNIGGVFAFLGNNLDDLIIGKLMGTSILGYYQNGFAIGQSAVGEMGDLSAQATFPAFGRIASDLPRLRRAFYLSLLGLAVVLSIPLILIILYSHALVLIVLGQKWLPIVPVLPWLTAAAYLQALNSHMFPINLIRSRTYYSAFSYLAYLILMVWLLLSFSAKTGLEGAGQALFWARALVQPLVLFGLFRSLYGKQKAK
ncbi:MAG TPA: oligosaccharide flippase family protein [Candidatus Saccharimonadia bacterium]|nr:oligosaccharide flippase family protein [Candidatus Saccharimonadia bacterium]